jgi:hypothetical protein
MAVPRPLARYGASSLAFALTLFFMGCGGGGAKPSVPQSSSAVNISLIPPPSSVIAGGKIGFIAVVTGTTNNTVTWQVNGTAGGNSAVGTITSAGLYTAPTTIPNPASVTVKAIAQADQSKSVSATVNITIGITPPTASVLVGGAQQQFTAIGTSVNWSLGGGGANLGTITPSGPDTATYTSPDAIPDPPLVTVVATSQSDSTQTTHANCTISAGGAKVNQASQVGAIKLGTSGGNVKDSSGNFCCSGTLGALLTRSGTQYILSNNHVLAESDKAKTGDPVSQPGLVDNNCSAGQTVANLSQFVKLESGTGTGTPPTYTGIADAAMAQVVSGKVDATGAILQLGTVSAGLAQPAPPSSTMGTPAVGMQVAKSGRTSGLTCSSIAAVNVQVEIDYSPSCGSNATAFTVIFNNQIDIVSTSFSAAGDSGSLIVDANTARPVGLLYGGSPSDTVANPIADVLNGLADPKTHVVPQIVGGPDHTVSACTGNGSPPGPVGQGLTAPTTLRVADDEMIRAKAVKTTYADELMSDPAVFGVGVTAGDVPGEAAIMVLVEQGKSHRPIPSTLNGVKVKVRYGQRIRAFSSCPDKGSSANSWSLPPE